MKKFKTYLTMAIVALVSMTAFTSCDPDDDIAYDLDGIWRGTMYVYHDGHRATESEIEFISNGSFSSSGYGHWVDYYDRGYWGGYDYIYNDIRWSVNNGVIHVHFVQENTDIFIESYTLTNRYFDGIINDSGNYIDFRLNRVTSPRRGSWDNYDDWYGDYYYDYYYYSKGKKPTTDSIPQRPVRTIGAPEKK